jgi:class 3 adenylate cyclase
VNTSSRLSGAAAGGEAWISANTRQQLGDLMPVDDCPSQSLKGMPAPIAVFRLRRAPVAASSPDKEEVPA